MISYRNVVSESVPWGNHWPGPAAGEPAEPNIEEDSDFNSSESWRIGDSVHDLLQILQVYKIFIDIRSRHATSSHTEIVEKGDETENHKRVERL